MLGRLKKLLTVRGRAERAHRRLCAAVLDTPPLRIVDAPLRFLSMCCHRDVLPYLVAVKSLYRRIGEGRFIIVDDGTLTAEDRAVLSSHLGAPEFLDIAAIDTGVCPRGGTWERLLSIIDRLGDYYVIQADADTVAIGPLDEVVRCYRENRSFALGTTTGYDFTSLAGAARQAQQWVGAGENHVQAEAEAAFDRLPDPDRRRYVRGSSGFAGFGRGAAARAEVEDFSRRMEALVGRRWSEWGTEQVTSNFVIANMPGSVVLPQPAYACYWGKGDGSDSVFLHFFGTFRFTGGVYASVTRREIEGMR